MLKDDDRAEDAGSISLPSLASTTRNARNVRAREGRLASGAQLYRLNTLGKLVLIGTEGEPIVGAIAHELLAKLRSEGLW
jgi:hypothetical protein